MANAIQCSFERYEKKYFLTPHQQSFLLSQMKPYVKPDDYGEYTICNIYYDTDDWRLIRASVEKPVYKEKLRVRSYGVPTDDSKIFVELKKKYDGIVYKRRITTEACLAEPFLYGLEPCRRYGQIGHEIAWFQKFYNTTPKVFIAYDRLAFAGIDDPDLRITFDTNMRWRDTDLDLRLGDCGQPIISDNRILMEVKMPGVCPLWLSGLLSEAGVFPTSFSKYGTCYLDHILKNQIEKTKEEAFHCA
ncbi:MAG: polyphosphate polymerase domain-containing protein [Oscillospiraceae bacterium]